MRQLEVDHGVDYERALERLQATAGAHFRRYRAAKQAGDQATTAQAREDYVGAQARARSLHPDDGAAIRAALEG